MQIKMACSFIFPTRSQKIPLHILALCLKHNILHTTHRPRECFFSSAWNLFFPDPLKVLKQQGFEQAAINISTQVSWQLLWSFWHERKAMFFSFFPVWESGRIKIHVGLNSWSKTLEHVWPEWFLLNCRDLQRSALKFQMLLGSVPIKVKNSLALENDVPSFLWLKLTTDTLHSFDLLRINDISGEH